MNQRALSGAALAATMAMHQHVTLDDEGFGRFHWSLAFHG